jgi:hypothetical protein
MAIQLDVTMPTIADFEAKFRALGDHVGQRMSARIKLMASTLIEELVLANTPVWSGQARSNWQVGINAKTDNFLKIPRPTKAHPPQPDAYFSVSASLELSIVNQATYRDAIHIFNNAPYIQRLNAGYSPQAEAGFVQAVIAQTVARVGSIPANLFSAGI